MCGKWYLTPSQEFSAGSSRLHPWNSESGGPAITSHRLTGGELGHLPEVEMKGLRVEATVVGIVRDPGGELAAGLRQPGVAEGAAVLLGGDPLLVEPVLVHLTL